MAVFAMLEKTNFNNRVSFCNSIKSSRILMMPCITYVKTEISTQIFHTNFSSNLLQTHQQIIGDSGRKSLFQHCITRESTHAIPSLTQETTEVLLKQYTVCASSYEQFVLMRRDVALSLSSHNDLVSGRLLHLLDTKSLYFSRR